MLATHSAIYLLGRIVPGAINLVCITIFAKTLGAEAYGNYAIAIASVGLLTSFFVQWPVVSVGRYCAEVKAVAEKEYLISAGVLSLGVSLFVGAIIFVFYFQDKLPPRLLAFVLAISAMQAWFELNLKIMNAFLNAKLYVFSGFLKSSLIFVFASCSVMLGYGLEGILLSVLLGLFFATLLTNQVSFVFSKKAFDFQLIRKMFFYGFPVSVSIGMIFLIDASDRFLIAYFLGLDAVGKYSSIYDLTQQTLGVLLGVVHLVILPAVLKAHDDKDKEKAKTLLNNGIFMLFFLGVPSVIGMGLLSDNIVSVFLGERFAEDTYVMPYIAFSIFLSCLKSFYLDYAFQLAKQMSRMIVVSMGGLLVNVALNFLLIPIYGILGAAIAACCAFGVCLILSFILGRSLYILPFPVFKIFSVILAGVLMALVLSLVSHWQGVGALLLQICLGFVLFGFCILVINREYITLIKRVVW